MGEVTGSDPRRSARILNDPSARIVAGGDLDAVFLPGQGMLCASLRHRGVEMLRRVDDLDALASKGSTAGIPFLHPWANRLAQAHYRQAGQDVRLDPKSPLLHFDDRGLPMHGVPWSMLVWELTESTRDSLRARLDWTRTRLLALFPFRHQLEMAVRLDSGALCIETTLIASPQQAVPVSFGFHPYLGIADVPRPQWHLQLPAMHRLSLDVHGIPTGAEEPFAAFDAQIGELGFDDGFALPQDQATFSISGGGRRIKIEFLSGYRYAQIFAPRGKDFIAIEPMTAPTSALTSGRGLTILPPNERLHAAFRIRVEA